jgi:hypothetical protein
MQTANIIPSAETASTTEASSAFTQFVLRQIECAKARAQLTVNQADVALVALAGGLISPEQAILILAECGLPLDEVSS